MKQPARRKAALRNNLEAYTFMAPYVIGVLAFFSFPSSFPWSSALGTIGQSMAATPWSSSA